MNLYCHLCDKQIPPRVSRTKTEYKIFKCDCPNFTLILNATKITEFYLTIEGDRLDPQWIAATYYGWNDDAPQDIEFSKFLDTGKVIDSVEVPYHLFNIDENGHTNIMEIWKRVKKLKTFL